ncbi:MAG: hypothetical protein MI810_04425 [Flavobacteriales bacterium]|nr:hypothetical protein [Flavobacteriales bacterium]
MRNRILILFTLPLLLLSCSESVESLIAENGDKAKSQFDQFYKCYEIAKTAAPIIKDEIKWEKDDANTTYGESNVYQIGFESFKELGEPLDIPFDGTRRREHADMAKLFNIDLSSHNEAHDYAIDPDYSYNKVESGESCANAIRHFLDAKYLLINRISVQSEPMVVGDESFVMGYVGGDVLVFDVTSAKLLGGFVVETESNDYIQVSETADIKANLDASLSHKTYRTTIEKFVDLTPSVEKGDFEF